MLRYKVPQDVQREDRIIGPLTFKQLIILGAGGGLAYAIYVTLAKTYFIEVWLPPVAIVAGITLAFTFLQIHSLPFHVFLMNFIEYNILQKKRIWIQGKATPFISLFREVEKEEKKPEEIKKKEKSIEELTKVLDTHGESELTETELTKEEKKEGLKKIIEQNYKDKS